MLCIQSFSNIIYLNKTRNISNIYFTFQHIILFGQNENQKICTKYMENGKITFQNACRFIREYFLLFFVQYCVLWSLLLVFPSIQGMFLYKYPHIPCRWTGHQWTYICKAINDANLYQKLNIFLLK